MQGFIGADFQMCRCAPDEQRSRGAAAGVQGCRGVDVHRCRGEVKRCVQGAEQVQEWCRGAGLNVACAEVQVQIEVLKW